MADPGTLRLGTSRKDSGGVLGEEHQVQSQNYMDCHSTGSGGRGSNKAMVVDTLPVVPDLRVVAGFAWSGSVGEYACVYERKVWIGCAKGVGRIETRQVGGLVRCVVVEVHLGDL